MCQGHLTVLDFYKDFFKQLLKNNKNYLVLSVIVSTMTTTADYRPIVWLVIIVVWSLVLPYISLLGCYHYWSFKIWKCFWLLTDSFDYFFLKNWANSGLFFVLFSVFFKQTLQFLQQINVKKCPSSIRRRDSNPRPFEHESSPITTRPGLPPNSFDY